MNTLGERIKYLREINKINQQELANATQISRSNISKIENGTLSPTANSIVSLASHFNVSTDWLLTGSEHKEDNSSELKLLKELNSEELEELSIIVDFLKFKRQYKIMETTPTNPTLPPIQEPPIAATIEENVVYLPILGDAAAGIPIEIIEMKQGEVAVDERHGKHNSFIVRAKGESMIEAGINNGDLVVVKPQPSVENGEIALVNINGEATIKYFYLYSDRCELRSANQDFAPMQYSCGDITILGKVVEVINQE